MTYYTVTLFADYRQIFNSDGYTLVKEGDKTMLEIKIEMHEV